MSDEAQLVLRVALVVVPWLAFLVWVQRRWKEIRRGGPPQEAGAGKDFLARRLEAGPWGRAVRQAVAQAAKTLGDDGSPEALEARAALAALEGRALDALIDEGRVAAHQALRSGEFTSLLLDGQGDLRFYALFCPGRLDQPQLLRRFAPFAEGWLAHVEAVAAPEGAVRLLTLAFFLRPDAGSLALHVGLRAEKATLLPGGLLDERESRAKVGRVLPESCLVELGA